MTTDSYIKILLRRLEKWDLHVFLEFYRSDFLKKNWIIQLAKIYSFFGNVIFWGLVWLILGFIGYFTKNYYLFLLITGGFQQSIFLHVLIRYVIVKRNRPYITLREEGVQQKDELIREHKSFPSGHVAFFIFFGCIFAFYLGNWIIFLIFLGLNVIMALTRVILGVHFPLDVIFGYIFGLLYALLYLGVTYQLWLDLFNCIGSILKSL